MISERQHEANRRNAAKSNGPKTPEGRAAVRHNALKHGLTAAEIILPTAEDKLEFEQFQASFEEECQPVGPIEQVLVEDIVANRWRMNRVRKMEPGFFALRMQVLASRIKDDFSTLDAQAHLALVFRDDAQDADTLGKMSRYEARFERSFHKSPQGVAATSGPPCRSVRFWDWDCFAKSDFTRSRPPGNCRNPPRHP